MPVTQSERELRSVTGEARRAQIIAATIDVIAESGYGQASFARIAERAGLSSTRLISYHFAGKDELIAAVTENVVTSIGQFMARRLEAERSASATLRAYIEGTVEFIATHRAPMKALLEILLGGGLSYDAQDDQEVVSHVEAVLRQGQAEGDFRDFDTRVMATSIQRSVEGLAFLLQSAPDLDYEAYAAELVTLYELGTRRVPS